MVDIDRAFIKNKENLIGLKDKMKEEMISKDQEFNDRDFN